MSLAESKHTSADKHIVLETENFQFSGSFFSSDRKRVFLPISAENSISCRSKDPLEGDEMLFNCPLTKSYSVCQ